MARRVDEFPHERNSRNRRRSYWHQWADGHIWELDTRTDLKPHSKTTLTAKQAVDKARAFATASGLFECKARVHNEHVFYVQFTRRDDTAHELFRTDFRERFFTRPDPEQAGLPHGLPIPKELYTPLTSEQRFPQ